ncbi:hypothetical protein CAF53_02255 [Sphingobium sp. LB126]|nr:hypothetical protein CAF53_02255 [Sphingobium sp. LB126]
MQADSILPDHLFLQAIAIAIEEAPVKYRVNLSSSNDRQRMRAADASAGWIRSRIRAVATSDAPGK